MANEERLEFANGSGESAAYETMSDFREFTTIYRAGGMSRVTFACGCIFGALLLWPTSNVANGLDSVLIVLILKAVAFVFSLGCFLKAFLKPRIFQLEKDFLRMHAAGVIDLRGPAVEASDYSLSLDSARPLVRILYQDLVEVKKVQDPTLINRLRRIPRPGLQVTVEKRWGSLKRGYPYLTKFQKKLNEFLGRPLTPGEWIKFYLETNLLFENDNVISLQIRRLSPDRNKMDRWVTVNPEYFSTGATPVFENLTIYASVKNPDLVVQALRARMKSNEPSRIAH
jgi:hypothetical protein